MTLHRIHLGLLATVMVALAAMTAFPASAQSGLGGAQKEKAAASGQQAQGGSSPLRVMLVISDAVRAYRVSVFLNHVDFGRRLAAEAEKVFRQTFTVVTTATSLPADPRAFDGVDLAVVLDVPQGEVRTGFFSTPMSLTAVFVVHNRQGEEVFRAREVANDNANNLYNGADRLGQAVTRQFIQEFLANPSVRNLQSPAAPVETKPVLADTSLMDSAGLDIPPPPPWEQPASGSANSAPVTSGRP